MRSARRGTAVIVLLLLLLAPGVAQAGTWSWNWNEIKAETFFNKLWSLIAFWQDDSGSDAMSKNGGTADPAGSGQPSPPSSSTSCDNGGTADPAGDPCNG
jgi:hypothetical protein